MTTTNPVKKVDPGQTSTTGAVGVAAATLCIFLSQKAGVDYTPEEAITITGALGTLFSFGFSVVRRKA